MLILIFKLKSVYDNTCRKYELHRLCYKNCHLLDKMCYVMKKKILECLPCICKQSSYCICNFYNSNYIMWV